jgi:hypothetical protein
MGMSNPLRIESKPAFRSTGPARSACGGQAPTSDRRAHSRTAADPSDPSLEPLANGRSEPLAARSTDEYKYLESLTQTDAEKFQLNCVPGQ